MLLNCEKASMIIFISILLHNAFFSASHILNIHSNLQQSIVPWILLKQTLCNGVIDVKLGGAEKARRVVESSYYFVQAFPIDCEK